MIDCHLMSCFYFYFSEPSLAFSHSPGCMFLTDVPDSPSSDFLRTKPDPELTPLCFCISHDPLHYSLASKAATAKIRQLEKIIGEDPGELTGNISLIF